MVGEKLPSPFIARAGLGLAASWVLLAAWAYGAPALAAAALAPAGLAALPGERLAAWQSHFLGPAPWPELLDVASAETTARLLRQRAREQVHYDRAWLLLGIVVVLAVLDLHRGGVAGPPPAEVRMLPALGLGTLLFRFVLWGPLFAALTDRLAADVCEPDDDAGRAPDDDVAGGPASPLPPLRRASPAAVAGAAAVTLALGVPLFL